MEYFASKNPWFHPITPKFCSHLFSWVPSNTLSCCFHTSFSNDDMDSVPVNQLLLPFLLFSSHLWFFSSPITGPTWISKIYRYNLSPKSKLLFKLLLTLLLHFSCSSIINCMKGRVKSCTVFNHKCESVANANPLTSLHLIQQLLWAVQGAAPPPAPSANCSGRKAGGTAEREAAWSTHTKCTDC